MNSLGQLPETRYYFRVESIHQPFIGVIRRVDRQLFRGDQSAPPLGTLPVIIDVTLADLLLLPEVGHVRGKVDSVGNHHTADLERRKKISQFTHNRPPTRFPSRIAIPIPLGATQSPTR